MKYGVALLSLFIVLAHAPAFAAGAEKGNGIDNPRAEHGSAWFLGKKKTIRACMDVSPYFSGQTAEQIQPIIENMFQTWVQYLNTKGYATHTTKDRLATKLSIMKACAGDEDLTFYFGTENPAVTSEKTRYENPTAFASRTTYDIKKGWGKGFVWIAALGTVHNSFPNWGLPKTLDLVILHELGHVFGCEHSVRTIMDPVLVSVIVENADDIPANFKPSVDLISDLVVASPFSYDGAIGSERFPGGRQAVLEFFSGRKISAEQIHGRLEIEGAFKTISITMNDGTGDYVLPVNVDLKDDNGAMFPSTNAFRTASGPRVGHSLGYEGVFYGTAKSANGETVIISIEYNAEAFYPWDFGGLGRGPVVVKFFHNNKPYVLFEARSAVAAALDDKK